MRFAPEVGRATAKNFLYSPRLADQLAVTRHEQSGGTADMRGRHAGAVQGLALLVRHWRDDFFAWRKQVRFAAAVTGGAAAREVADAIRVRRRPMGRTDRDDRIGIAGISDRDVAESF